jgi:hypothetical protein
MDAWGIVGGELLEQAAVISNGLRELSKTPQINPRHRQH